MRTTRNFSTFVARSILFFSLIYLECYAQLHYSSMPESGYPSSHAHTKQTKIAHKHTNSSNWESIEFEKYSEIQKQYTHFYITKNNSIWSKTLHCSSFDYTSEKCKFLRSQRSFFRSNQFFNDKAVFLSSYPSFGKISECLCTSSHQK